jgi:hypothetical protein
MCKKDWFKNEVKIPNKDILSTSESEEYTKKHRNVIEFVS